MERRKDKNNHVLKDGESYREKEHRYMYRWVDSNKKRHCTYAQTLHELRKKEAEINRNKSDGISSAGSNLRLGDVYNLWKKNKVGLKQSTYVNYLYMYEHFIGPKIGKMKIESVRLDGDAYIICNDEGKLLPLPPNRLYGPTDFFAGPFLICGDGGEDLISLTDSQITKYEKKYHSPLIFLELYPKPITLKCTPELYAKCMGEEHQHDTQENEHDER